MKTAYIIENNLRVSEVLVIEESYGTCLVRFPNGGGMRISRKRLYNTKEAAEKYLEDSRKKSDEYKPVYKPEPIPAKETYHSPHYYGWI